MLTVQETSYVSSAWNKEWWTTCKKLTCVDWFVNPSYASVELVKIAMWWWDFKLWGKLSMTPSIVISCESCTGVRLHISAKCLSEFDNFKWNVYRLVNSTFDELCWLKKWEFYRFIEC